MPNYRRAIVAGGTYFFTIVTYNRTKIFSDPAAVSILGDTIVEAKQEWPVTIDAIVLLPDHWQTRKGVRQEKVSSTNGINNFVSHCVASSCLSCLLGFVIKA